MSGMVQETQAIAHATVRATAKEWLRALTVAGAATSRRPPIPILHGVLITPSKGSVTVEAFDYETSARTVIPAEVEGDSPFCVSRSWLSKAVKMIAGRKTNTEVAVSVDGAKVTVQARGYTLVSDSMPASEYPETPERETASVTVDTRDLKAAIKRVSLAVNTDETMPILGAIEFRFSKTDVSLWATDRYRMGTEVVACKGKREVSVLLKARNLRRIIPKLEDDVTTFGFDTAAERVTIQSGRNTFTGAVVGGEYPKIESLFPAETRFAVEVDRAALLDAAVVAAEMLPRHNPCKLLCTADGATIEFSDGLWEGSTTPKADGRFVQGSEDHSLAFNPSYLADALRSIESCTVKVAGTVPARPWVFTDPGAEAGSHRHLLMPVRMPS